MMLKTHRPQARPWRMVVRLDPRFGDSGAQKKSRPAVTGVPPARTWGKVDLEPAEDALHFLFMAGLAGDNAAYADFLGRSSARLRAYFRRRLVGRPDDVEDLVQETLLAIHLQRHTYRPAIPVTAWLHAIARHKLIDLWRRLGARAEVAALDDDEAAEHDAPALADASAGAFEARRDLLVLLAGLPDRFRLPIVHVKIEGRSIAETALLTGLSEASVKVGVHRGLKLLARRVRKP